MHPSPDQLLQLLRDNPNIILAMYDPARGARTVTILTDPADHPNATLNCKAVDDYSIVRTPARKFRPLICAPSLTPNDASHTDCQDEPILLGTQLQPAGARWVGTAGLPVRWADQAGHDHWGILSNWHVMHGGIATQGSPQHQPTVAQPACAHLTRWTAPDPNATNYADCAMADALIDGYHTIADELLDIGPPGDTTIDAKLGLPVIKSGRTTGLTHGTCTAVGAAVRVDYGDFVALFADQDIFAADTLPFSAPGDSGSAILGRDCSCPCSLLFAGNDTLTVGNPMRHVTKALNLLFPFH